MTEFFRELLDAFTGEKFLEKVRGKYHYETEQMPELTAVAERMLPLLSREAAWERKPWESPGQEGPAPGEGRELVVMTLGPELDALQEAYLKRGLLTEGYMIESLAGELLLQAYGSYNRYVAENTPFHVAGYHFFGSEENFPIERLPGVLRKAGLAVSCNGAFCMLPKKSVAFVAELTEAEDLRCPGICTGCGSQTCPNRVNEEGTVYPKQADIPMNYGFRRIFGAAH